MMTRAPGPSLDLFRGVWHALWPSRCPLCREPLSLSEWDSFCSWCLETIKPVGEPVCRVCGRALSEAGSPPQEVCGFCTTHPPSFDLARVHGIYEGALREAIRDFKFKGKRSLAPAQARLMAEAFSEWFTDVSLDAVVPVPLHKSRIAERGFNQAVDLARPVGRARDLPVLYDALLRTRPTEPQYGLTINQRRENVRGAFSTKRPELVKDRSLILVDDILTTGTTVSECAKMLKRAGAKKVAVLALARAV